MKFRTDRLLISTVSLDYLNEIHQLHSLPEVDEFNTLGIPASAEVTKELILDWLEKQEAEPRLSYVFCIKLITTNQFIGLIGLNIGKIKYRIAEVWYKMDPLYWNKGYATEALLQVLAYGFNTLKLHRVEAGCAVGNMASVKVLEKAGMIQEGRKRAILPIRENWVDNYIYAILESDFKNKKLMNTTIHDLVRKAYKAFNSRNIDSALSTFHAEVEWPKAFEGGYVSGHDEIRKYWTRQWTEINPHVEPTGFNERQDGKLEVQVHQVVKDLQGTSLFDGMVKHIYLVKDGLLRKMDIEME